MLKRRQNHMPIPFYSAYAINENGEIISIDSGDRLTYETDGYGTVRVQLKNDKFRVPVKARVSRLVLETFQPILDGVDPAWASVIHLDGDKSNVKLSNLKWEISGYNPILIPGINVHPDAFVTIPEYSNYEINLSGTVRNRKTGYFVKVSEDKAGYIVTSISDDNHRGRSVGIHRLLALTFLVHPTNVEHLSVNHKDGNKKNNLVWNLEWTTPLENLQHAERLGLRRNIPSEVILAMNVQTREIREFKSLAECGRFFKVSGATIRDPLNNPRGIRPYKGYFLKRKSDKTKWPVGALSDFGPEGRPVVLKEILSGEIIKFRTIKDAAMYLGKSTSNLWHQIMKPHPTPYLGHLARLDTPDIDWNLYNVPKQRFDGIKTICLTTNETKTWPSVKELAKELRVGVGPIYAAIGRGTPFRDLMIDVLKKTDV